MTEDHISRGITDALLSSGTCDIQTSSAVDTSLSSCGQDAPSLDLSDTITELNKEETRESQTHSNILTPVLEPSQGDSSGIQGTGMSEDKLNPLIQASKTGEGRPLYSDSLERIKMAEVANVTSRDFDLLDMVQVDMTTSTRSTLGRSDQEFASEEDATARSQPAAILCEGSNDSEDDCGIEGHTAPQAGAVDDDGSNIISERPVLSETTSTGLPMRTMHHDDTTEIMTQNKLDQNVLLMSKNQMTKVTDFSIMSKNREDMSKVISNMHVSTHNQDQTVAKDLNTESTGVDSTPATERIPQTFQNIMTRFDGGGQGEIVCGADAQRSDIIDASIHCLDPQIRSTVGEILNSTNPEIITIVQERIYHIDSKISDFTKKCTSNSDEIVDLVDVIEHSTDPAIIGIVGDIASRIDYGKGNIVVKDDACNTSILDNDAGEISSKTDQEESKTVGKTTHNSNYEISGILGDSCQHFDTEVDDISGDSGCKINSKQNNEQRSADAAAHRDSEACYILGATAYNTDLKKKYNVEETVADNNSELNTMPKEPIVFPRSEMYDLVGHDMTVASCGQFPEPEIPVIEEALPKLTDDNVSDRPVLRQPSSPLGSVQPCNKRMSEVNDNSTLISGCPGENTNGTPADRLLENVLIQIAQVPVTESDPVVKSQTHPLEESMPDRITQLSTPSSHQLESVTVCSRTENNPDTLLIPSFLDTPIESPRISVKGETDLPLLGHPHTPAAGWDLEPTSRGVKGDCSEVTDVTNSSELSNELWLDACQFLTCEEDRSSIFDEWGHSPVCSPPEITPDNTVPSQERATMTGQWAGDWELPPVERWSSSDSWASALSDWFQSVNVLPDDSLTTTTTTAGCSSCVGSQKHPSTAIQGTSDDQRSSLEPPSSSKRTCFGNVCSPSTGTGLGGVEDRPPRGYNTNRPGLEKQDKDMRFHVNAYEDRMPQDLSNNTLTPRKKEAAVEMVIPTGAFIPTQESSQDTMPSLLQRNDCSTGGCINQSILGTKLDSTALSVTEHRASRLSPDFEEEGERNYGLLRFSDYSSEKDPKPGCVSGKERRTELNPHLETHGNRHVLSEAEHLTHAHGVETSRAPSRNEESGSTVCAVAQDLDTTSTEREGEHPAFIMPFVPVNVTSSFHHPCEVRQVQTLKQFLIDPLPGNSTSGEETSIDQFNICHQKSLDPVLSSPCGDVDLSRSEDWKIKAETHGNTAVGNEPSKIILPTGGQFMILEEKRVAYVTLDFYDNVLNFSKHPSVTCDKNEKSLPKANCDVQLYSEAEHKEELEMPPKTPKTPSEGQSHSRHKSKTTGHQAGPQSRKHEKVKLEGVKVDNKPPAPDSDTVAVIETIIITEKTTPKSSGKKKKKKTQGQQAAAKPEREPVAEEAKTTMPTTIRTVSENSEVKLTKPGKVREQAAPPLTPTPDIVSTAKLLKVEDVMQNKETDTNVKSPATEVKSTCVQEAQTTCPSGTPDDDVIKRRRISKASTEAVPIRTRPQLPAIFRQRSEEEAGLKRAYSDVVKQKTQTAKEVVPPRVVTEIQVAPVHNDTQSISLWCQFSPVPADSTITWTKAGSLLSQEKRGVGDDGRVTLTIRKACSKDLGLYRCSLTAPHASVSTSDYHLTSEVLMELVIPSHDTPAEQRDVATEKEDVHCAPLLFKEQILDLQEDILTDQYFGENQTASIVTEKVHFGEGMHRKAFRTTLQAGMVPIFRSGHHCVLKVHNSISYGTKNNEELVQKNYNLAVEECHVQNTAREYIKAYTQVAKSAESFGEVPEIIPIYLVHRPSSDIPYATLEEELIGDFVKYSVRDGKEINLMRRDSEAGQKCCAFQHWVYSQTDGNLLVTDMQGVGMKLTDVGIATCKKGYKGFKGNCATSFIDQFKALHQCNKFCELLGLTSLQPKPKRTVAPPKPKTQPTTKKKPFGPVLKGKS